MAVRIDAAELATSTLAFELSSASLSPCSSPSILVDIVFTGDRLSAQACTEGRSRQLTSHEHVVAHRVEPTLEVIQQLVDLAIRLRQCQRDE